MISAIAYDAAKDMEVLTFHPSHVSKAKPKVEKGRFRIWWDDEGQICAVAITGFTKELEEFSNTMHSIRLGGIWKGLEITEDDIADSRKDLLKKLESKWQVEEDDEQTEKIPERGEEEAHR